MAWAGCSVWRRRRRACLSYQQHPSLLFVGGVSTGKRVLDRFILAMASVLGVELVVPATIMRPVTSKVKIQPRHDDALAAPSLDHPPSPCPDNRGERIRGRQSDTASA